jgi:hypothetical protein
MDIENNSSSLCSWSLMILRRVIPWLRWLFDIFCNIVTLGAVNTVDDVIVSTSVVDPKSFFSDSDSDPQIIFFGFGFGFGFGYGFGFLD